VVFAYRPQYNAIYWCIDSYTSAYKTKKPPIWEALEFSFSFLHRKSASKGGLNKKENKKAEYIFVHGLKLKP